MEAARQLVARMQDTASFVISSVHRRYVDFNRPPNIGCVKSTKSRSSDHSRMIVKCLAEGTTVLVGSVTSLAFWLRVDGSRQRRKMECQRMTKMRNGRRISVPASRRLSWDLLYFHRDVPLCAHDRRMNLAEVSSNRNASAERVSWPALFLKAYAIVAQDVPELRQTWYRWPWAHLYQHPFSVATLTVQREMNGEPWLFWGQIVEPELISLCELQRAINKFRDGDVLKVFRKQLQLAKQPMIIRRMIWWWNLNVATATRAKRLGTFFLSTLAGRGAEIQLPPSIHTGCLTFGPLDENGIARVTLAYDHRIMDGALVADILQRLEVTLTGALLDELRVMRETKRADAA